MDFEKILTRIQGILQGIIRQPFGLKPFFGRIGLLLVNASGTDIEALGENDGTLKVSNYGKAGATLTAFKVETTGEQDNVMHGKQTGGTIGALNLNANNVLRVELISGGAVQVDPLLITSSETILWNPGATAAELYEVMFNIVNSTSSSVSGVNIGQDLAAGGSLTAAEYWVQGLIIPGNGYSGWFGPFVIKGTDDIRGVAGTTNVLSIHWRIKRVFVHTV